MDRICSTADGIPLLVEELLASPGRPTSFADTVRRRLAQFDPTARRIIDHAAVLGRQFDWRLLETMTGQSHEVVAKALESGVEQMLLRVEEASFGFRHALTREAVLTELLPPARASMATSALAALRARHPGLDGETLDLAVELAHLAGNATEESVLLTEAGRRALGGGALATAIEALTAAVRADSGEVDHAARILLVDGLALAGRVDEALQAAVAAQRSDEVDRPDQNTTRILLHTGLAQAAVSAGRWALAAEQLSIASALATNDPNPELVARIAVLESEVALAGDAVDVARRMAEQTLQHATRPSDLRCHALEVLGRIERFSDQAAARHLFEEALRSADTAELPVWRTRALHQLGTLDMFDHLGTDLLDRARRSAEQQGALATVASLDLQLAAVNVSRWSPSGTAAHAREALAMAEALSLPDVREKAFLFLAEASALQSAVEQMEEYLALGQPALTSGDAPAAIEHLDRATTLLDRFPRAEPAAFRALWPLLLASGADPRAATAINRARELGVEAFNANRGLLAYADAVTAGRRDGPAKATPIAAEADRRLVNCPTWRTLARALAAGAAAADGWGDPTRWLHEGVVAFTRLDLAALAQWCQQRLPAGADPRRALGITPREADVLRLVADGLANKEIAATLHVSPRTIEKHIESLLRKTGARSRTQLAVQTVEAGGQVPKPARKA
jgi:DNA-binding CsgD family transcriptional regulator